MGKERPCDLGLTFGDVLLAPGYSDVIPSDTNVDSKFSKNINLFLPIVSSAMDTVTEDDMAIAVVQLLAAVALLYFGSQRLVGAVDVLSANIGMSPLGLALIIVPAATAIPETASALIWGYRGKDTLCLGSLVGEKILYSTFYPGLGLLLTSWVLDIHAYTSVAATTIISLILLYYIYKRAVPWYALCFGILFFISYSIMIFAFRI